MKNLLISLIGVLILLLLFSCKPIVHLSTIHPDSDKEITFTASKGTTQGTVTEMQLEIEESNVATQSGTSLTYTGGPYPPYSNQKLNYRAIAVKSGNSNASTSGWVYVANPKGVYAFNTPNGSNNGYPNSSSEQTGANLYRLDKRVVKWAAQDALMEYANEQDTTVKAISNIADEMVAAVAFYVDVHMSWRMDDFNFLPVSDLAFADFNGDGTTDIFAHWGSNWHVSFGGGWREFAASAIGVSNLGFGDFGTSSTNSAPDGITDVFSHWGGKWHISFRGRDAWHELNTSNIGVGNLGFGDFGTSSTDPAPDGITDVFSQWGGKWHVSFGGTSSWYEINTSNIAVSNLRFGDFGTSATNPAPDGITDVFSHWGGKWHVSYGGTSSWQDLATSNIGVNDLGFGDFNSDGITDVFSYWNDRWHVSDGGAAAWQDYGPVTNRIVFADNGYANYSPGWDFPQPANLTLTISGNLTNANSRDDYQGDCEDHAILRAALLRVLGFAPWAIWDAIDNPVSHEYNIVLYEGAYRLMDYGRIERFLERHTWDSHRSHYGWNEDNGPRGVSSTNHDYLKNNTDNFPGGKECPGDWSYEKYYKSHCK